MYEHVGYTDSLNWLRDIAKVLGIKVGGKRVWELMVEIQQRLERNANNRN